MRTGAPNGIQVGHVRLLILISIRDGLLGMTVRMRGLV